MNDANKSELSISKYSDSVATIDTLFWQRLVCKTTHALSPQCGGFFEGANCQRSE